MHVLWLALAVLVPLSVAAVIRGSRRRRLAQLRSVWGAPIERARRLDAISTSHGSRIAALGGRSLDDRTWADLNLDQVFAAFDRTQSTLGQHALYHRLRSAPAAADLDAFEALVHRMTIDAAARERAQLVLSRLQDPHGYDVWWLADLRAVERHVWYGVFPVLSFTAIALAFVAPFWSAAVVPLVAVLATNIVVRYLTDFRIATVARSFRQCAPLIATGESLGFLSGDDIDPIVRPLRVDAPMLARLKSISRWVNGDPFMLAATADPFILQLNDVVAAVYEYLNLAFLLDGTGVYFALNDLARHGSSLVRAAAAAGDVDAAIGIASFRTGRLDSTRSSRR